MADRFWVGGSGNTNDTGHWSATSGGASGASVPTSADNAIWDANSNSGGTDYTVTVNATFACLDLNFSAAPTLGGTITLAGAFNINCYGSRTLLAGMTYSHNGSTTFLATSGTKTLTSNGASTICLQTVFNGAATFQLADDLTLASGQLWRANGTFDVNGKTVTMSGAAQALDGTFTGTNAFFNLSFVGTALKTAARILSGNIEVTGTFKYLGNSVTNRLLIQSNTLGTARTITAAAIDAASDYCNFRDIAGAGAAAPFATGSSLGDCLGNSGITFTTPATQTATGTASFTWSTHGWTSRVPLPQDDVVINNAFVAGRTITMDMPHMGKSIDCSGATGSPTLNFSVVASLYGSLNLGGVTPSGTSATTFAARSAVTLTSNGKTFTQAVTLNGPGGTLTLADALITNGALTKTNGTLADGGFSVTALSYSGGSGATTTKSGTWTLTGSGAVWSESGTITDSGTIKLTDATATAKTFASGSKAYNIVWLAGAGSGSFNFTGSPTIAELKVSDGAKTIKLTAGTNTTISSFTDDGASPVTLTSITAAAHTITKAGGGTVLMDGATVSYSTASPASTFYAGGTGTDGGNNTNWSFTDVPVFVALTGVAGTAAAGSVLASFALAADGAAGTGAVGSLSISSTVATDGVAATTAISLVVPSAVLDLIGTEGTGDVGVTLPASVFALLGTEAASAVGTAGVTASLSITGVSGTGGVGEVVPPPPPVVVALSGVQATVSVGALTVSFALDLAGVSGSGAAGAVSIPINGIVVREKPSTVFLRAKSEKVFLRAKNERVFLRSAAA